jgi:protein SCO1/2
LNTFWRKQGYKITMILISCILLAAIFYVYFLRDEASDFPVQGEAAAFELSDIQGEPVSIDNTSGNVRLLYFFFANCPDVCPPTTHMLSKVQERLQQAGVFGSDANILQVTFDPIRDTVDTLTKYAANFNADLDAWRFLRGKEDETKSIGEKYGIFINKDPETGFFIHSNTVILIDPNNQIRMRYNGNDLNDEKIASDVLKLIAE